MKNMITTTRNKHKQMKKAEEAAAKEKSLIQETTDESENDSSYLYEYESGILSDKSFITIQEISENTISDISDLNIINDDIEINDQSSKIIDDIEINKQSKKERTPPSKITKPKTNWVWKFFKLNENNIKTICQIDSYEKMLVWCDFSSSIKIHLLGVHQISKTVTMRYQE